MRPLRDPQGILLTFLISLVPHCHILADGVLVEGLALGLKLKPPAMSSNL